MHSGPVEKIFVHLYLGGSLRQPIPGQDLGWNEITATAIQESARDHKWQASILATCLIAAQRAQSFLAAEFKTAQKPDQPAWRIVFHRAS